MNTLNEGDKRNVIKPSNHLKRLPNKTGRVIKNNIKRE
jgi:hypothetical protein